MAADLWKDQDEKILGSKDSGVKGFWGSSGFQMERKGGSVIANRVLDCLGKLASATRVKGGTRSLFRSFIYLSETLSLL